MVNRSCWQRRGVKKTESHSLDEFFVSFPQMMELWVQNKGLLGNGSFIWCSAGSFVLERSGLTGCAVSAICLGSCQQLAMVTALMQ